MSTQTALLEVLHGTIPHVNPPVLKATLPLLSRILRAVVASADHVAAFATETKDELGGANALLRWTCRTTSTFLQHLDKTTDAKAVKQLLMGTLLALFKDRRPKVRKAAQSSVLELLVTPKNKSTIAETISAFIQNAFLKEVRSEDKVSTESLNELLHILPFLERSIMYLNYRKLGPQIAEFLTTLLHRSMHSTNGGDFVAVVKVKESSPRIMVIGEILAVFLVVMEEKSDEQMDVNRSAFLNDFATRILASLLQAKPSLVFCEGAADSEILSKVKIAYGQVVIAACSKIIAHNKDLAVRLLPPSVQMLVLLSKPVDADAEDHTVASVLMVELNQIFRMKLPGLLNEKLSGLNKSLEDLLRSMERVMTPGYRPTWSISLRCSVVLMSLLRRSLAEEVQNTLESLLLMHEEFPAGSLAAQSIEDALSSFIQEVGIEEVWGMISWTNPNGSKNGGKPHLGSLFLEICIMSHMFFQCERRYRKRKALGVVDY
jgi:hypothetical protein